MEDNKDKDTNLTKFPDSKEANATVKPTLPSAFDLFGPSVELIKNNLVAFLILMGVPLVLLLIGQGPQLFSHKVTPFTSEDAGYGIFILIGLIATALASPGLIVLQLKAVRKQAVDWQSAFKEGLHYFWRMVGLAILTFILLTVSFLLLIVPFFFVLPRIILAPYFMIDRNLGPVDALKASSEAYKQHKGVWGLIGVYVLLGLPSAVPVIGWLISNVLTFLYTPAMVIRYEQLKALGTTAATTEGTAFEEKPSDK